MFPRPSFYNQLTFGILHMNKKKKTQQHNVI